MNMIVTMIFFFPKLVCSFFFTKKALNIVKPKVQIQKSKSKSKLKGLWLSIRSKGPPTTHNSKFNCKAVFYIDH